MTKLPVVSGNQCISALSLIGYQVAHSKGSHIRLRCPGRKPVTVPRHHELDPGLLRRIIRDAGITVEEFVRLLKG